MNIGVVLNFVEGFADALDYSLFNIVKKNLSTFTISGLTQNKKYNLSKEEKQAGEQIGNTFKTILNVLENELKISNLQVIDLKDKIKHK